MEMGQRKDEVVGIRNENNNLITSWRGEMTTIVSQLWLGWKARKRMQDDEHGEMRASRVLLVFIGISRVIIHSSSLDPSGGYNGLSVFDEG